MLGKLRSIDMDWSTGRSSMLFDYTPAIAESYGKWERFANERGVWWINQGSYQVAYREHDCLRVDGAKTFTQYVTHLSELTGVAEEYMWDTFDKQRRAAQAQSRLIAQRNQEEYYESC